MNKTVLGKSYEEDRQVRLGELSLDKVFRKGHADKVTFKPGYTDE